MKWQIMQKRDEVYEWLEAERDYEPDRESALEPEDEDFTTLEVLKIWLREQKEQGNVNGGIYWVAPAPGYEGESQLFDVGVSLDFTVRVAPEGRAEPAATRTPAARAQETLRERVDARG